MQYPGGSNKVHVCLFGHYLFQQLQVMYLGHRANRIVLTHGRIIHLHFCIFAKLHLQVKRGWQIHYWLIQRTPASFMVDNMTTVALSCLSESCACPPQRGSAAAHSDWCTVQQEASPLISTLKRDFKCSSRNSGDLKDSVCMYFVWVSAFQSNPSLNPCTQLSSPFLPLSCGLKNEKR